MSGPKDYRYFLSAIRRAEIQRRRAQEREARQAAVRARLEAQREQAAAIAKEMHLRRAQEREARQAALRVRLDLQREQAAIMAKQASEKRLQVARELAAVRHSIAKGRGEKTQDAIFNQEQTSERLAEADDPSLAQSQPETASSHTETHTVAAVPLAESIETSVEDGGVHDRQKIDSFIGELLQWRNEMSQDEDVLAYQGKESADWQRKVTNLLEQYSSGTELVAVVDSIEHVVSEGKQIHSLAGERKAQFATRNEVLTDIISSLQEIGFFVADPQFEDGSNPAGAVLVRATRGNETMVASVDLSDTIKSVWNGVADEKCKDAFFDYVENMNRKGVTIEPLRADLQSRPTLLEKGAKELPTSGQNKKERNS